MVLIISENSDISTNHVIEWITNVGYPFVRINWEDKVEIKSFNLNSFSLLVNDKVLVEYEKITSVWFRRGKIKLNESYLIAKSDKDKFTNYLREHLKVELKAYEEYIYHLLYKKRHIGSFDKLHINKFIILDKAVKCGLSIPQTYVVSSKQELEKLLFKHGELITKSSNYVLNFEYASDDYMTYTEVIDQKSLAIFPNLFAPSLCQVMIKKVYDVRIFFLNDECYAMVIFSQKREESKVDFRKYDYINPSRRVPYELNEEIILAIKKLMNLINLKSGSIDIVVDEKGDHYFLEVNPVGQYGMVEFPCNYKLNEKIAKYLING